MPYQCPGVYSLYRHQNVLHKWAKNIVSREKPCGSLPRLEIKIKRDFGNVVRSYKECIPVLDSKTLIPLYLPLWDVLLERIPMFQIIWKEFQYRCE